MKRNLGLCYIKSARKLGIIAYSCDDICSVLAFNGAHKAYWKSNVIMLLPLPERWVAVLAKKM
jgi:hypothetical protein